MAQRELLQFEIDTLLSKNPEANITRISDTQYMVDGEFFSKYALKKYAWQIVRKESAKELI